jgi:Thr operon leader peptide
LTFPNFYDIIDNEREKGVIRDMALSQEAVQSMLDAMKIISSAEMNNISYDTTIVCTITDTSHAAKESYYMVTDGSVKFKAYVLSTEDTIKYKVDD